jgi:hypothetical protein
MYVYTFSFDTTHDARVYGKPDVDVLDYDFGGEGQHGTRPNKAERETYPDFPATAVHGPMPRAGYLYVKWRVQSTKEVYERRIELADRLPEDPGGYEVHFVIDKEQIFVYLLPPPTVWNRDIFYNDDPAYQKYRLAHQIYPNP